MWKVKNRYEGKGLSGRPKTIEGQEPPVHCKRSRPGSIESKKTDPEDEEHMQKAKMTMEEAAKASEEIPWKKTEEGRTSRRPRAKKNSGTEGCSRTA